MVKNYKCGNCNKNYDLDRRQPLLIIPCKHIYCHICLDNRTNCPECKIDITRTNPDNQMRVNLLNETNNDEDDDLNLQNIPQENAYDYTYETRREIIFESKSKYEYKSGNTEYDYQSSKSSRDDNYSEFEIEKDVNKKEQKFSKKNFCLNFIYLIIGIFYSLPFILIGTLYPKCTIEPRIALWSIVYGVGAFWVTLLFYIKRIYSIGKKEKKSKEKFLLTITIILFIGEIVWFFVGCVWIYQFALQITFSNDDHMSKMYCNPILYIFSVSMTVTTGVILIATLAIIGYLWGAKKI